jgi:integrase/recombinase XerD
MRGLWFHPTTGKPYYRCRAKGRECRIPLPDLPKDHPDFLAAWADAARTHKPQPKPSAGTLASILSAVKASSTWHGFSDGYRLKLLPHIAHLSSGKIGAAMLRAVREPHIRKDMGEAVDPRTRLKAWRLMIRFALDKTWITTDPAAGIKPPRAARTDGHPEWTADHIAAFRARWPIGTVPRAAMELIFWTGFRVSDAVLAGPQMVDRDGVLVVRQVKTKGVAYVPWTCALPAHVTATDRDLMHAALAPLRGHLTFLATAQGRTRSAKGLATMMQAACKAAEIPVSAHGLRKSRTIALIEGGATPHETGAWTGHESLGEIVRYGRGLDRKKAVMGTPAEPTGRLVPDHIGTGRK